MFSEADFKTVINMKISCKGLFQFLGCLPVYTSVQGLKTSLEGEDYINCYITVITSLRGNLIISKPITAPW